jgi:hypothetical protein
MNNDKEKKSSVIVKGNDIDSKIEIITKSLTRHYFKSILKKLAIENPDNAEIICNYIIAEQNEIPRRAT